MSASPGDRAHAETGPILAPRVVRVQGSPDLTYLTDQTLRARVAAALDAMPKKPNGKPVRPSRRVLLGYGGQPIPGAAAFFRKTKGKADGTEKVYASVLRRWVDWCQSTGTDPLYMDFDVLEDYRDDVRLDEDGVSHGTWNSGIPAFRWFHDAAVAAGHIENPLMSTDDWRRLKLVDRSVRWPRVVSAPDYALFKAIGLTAMTIDGQMTRAAYSLRSPVRDALFADFLLAHGTRRAEACHLTLLDLPLRIPGRSSNTGQLPPQICKWASGRELEESAAWVNRLAAYHDTEWFVTVETAQRSLNRRNRSEDLLVVTDVAHRFENTCKVHIRGVGWRRLFNLTKENRRALVCTAEVIHRVGSEFGMGHALTIVPNHWLVPLAVFPGTRSPMLSPEAWSMTFREANDRVGAALAKSGRASIRRVTPHMLRHTFATSTLADELGRAADADRDHLNKLREARNTDTATIRRRYMNPLLRVQRLLGHRSLDTTLLYLQYLTQESRASIPSGDSWIERFLGVAS